MDNGIKDMGSIGVFTKDMDGLDCRGFVFNHDEFPLDYVEDVISAVTGYMKSAKASGNFAPVEFNIAMYLPVGSFPGDVHIRLVASNVKGGDCQYHSVAYFEVDGVSKRVDSDVFMLDDVLAYLKAERGVA